MKTTKGLYLDTAFADTPVGYLTFAKNILLTEKLGVIQNEKGFLHHVQVPYTIIGVLPVLNKTVFWSTNDSFSEVGVLENGVYTKIINDTDIAPATLNFKLTNPIDAEFHITALNEIVVAWIDELNTPKIVNISNPSFQANDLELFPAANLVIPEIDVIQFGGSLPSGVYKITYYYEDLDGSTSNYATPAKPASIIRDANSNSPDQVWGVAGGTITNKAINIVVTPTDPNWSYINFVAIKTINNVTTAVKFKRLSISPGSTLIQTTYTGAEAETTISLNEILTPHAFYINAKAITQLNNRLYLGNLTTTEEYKVQKFALGIQLKWRATLHDVVGDSVFREASGTDHGSFAHGEVYAFYVQVRDRRTGIWSKGFHIPGRAMNVGDDVLLSPSPSGGYRSGTGSPPFKKYQLEDTVTSLFNISPGVVGGVMGFWENENEVYPNNEEYNGTVDYNGNPIVGGVDYRGQKVRHHKFPTIRTMRNAFAGDSGRYGVSTLDSLTIDASAVNFPAELDGKISAWRIVYAKRDIANATVLGTSGVFYYGVGRASHQLKPTMANGTNRENGLTDANAILMGTDATGGFDRSQGAEFIRFNAFNLMVDRPAVAPTYLRQELRHSFVSGASLTPNTDPRLVLDSASTDGRKWMLFDPTITTHTTVAALDTYRFRNVNFVQYLPTQAIVSVDGFTINNRCGEDALVLKNNVVDLSVNDKVMLLYGPWADHILYADSKTHNTFLSSLCALKSDVYNSFDAQDLVATAVVKEITNIIPNDSLIDIAGGDNWQGPHSLHLQGPVDDNTEFGPAGNELQGIGSKSVHFLVTEAPKNLNYRHSEVGNPESFFYSQSNLLPKINNADWDTRYLGLMNITKPPVYLYNPDYNTLNDLGLNLTAYDPTVVTEEEFPTTVARSVDNPAESNFINWKTFLVSDRYTMPRNKGVIENLQGVGNQRLFIHLTDSLYITKDRTTLQGSVADVTLGSGDIFEVTPFEVLSSDQGYAGTQHKFACVSTKIGYIFPDMSQGKIFIHDGEALNEISKNGLRQFWRDHLNKDLQDNPFTGTGVTLAYDEVYNRVLLTAIDNNHPTRKFITASYSPQLEAWASFHDHDSNFLYSTRGNKTFSVKTLTPGGPSDVYLHNVGPYGRYFNQDTALTVPYPMLIEVLYNDAGYIQKSFSSVTWISQALDLANLDQLSTFDFITARSSSKGTGKVPISLYTELVDSHVANTRYVEGEYGFNQLRNLVKQIPGVPIILPFEDNFALNPAALDLNKDWYQQGRMVDTYLAVRFEYLNSNNYKFALLDHGIDFRQSIR